MGLYHVYARRNDETTQDVTRDSRVIRKLLLLHRPGEKNLKLKPIVTMTTPSPETLKQASSQFRPAPRRHLLHTRIMSLCSL